MASENLPIPLLPNGLNGIYDRATDTLTLQVTPQGWTALVETPSGVQSIAGQRANGKVSFMIQTAPDITPEERQPFTEELTEMGLTQEMIGKFVGVSQPTIHRDQKAIKNRAASKD